MDPNTDHPFTHPSRALDRTIPASLNRFIGDGGPRHICRSRARRSALFALQAAGARFGHYVLVRATIALVFGAVGLLAVGCSDGDSGSGPEGAEPAPDRVAVECVAGGEPAAVVPDVIGESLRDAIDTVEEAGLNVVDSGVSDGDAVGEGATVRAQEPAAGTRVPPGACVGFRTEG
ncbi:MAG: PASTA domain-containing protein [Candidatus Limnocylindrales bacterium]